MNLNNYRFHEKLKANKKSENLFRQEAEQVSSADACIAAASTLLLTYNTNWLSDETQPTTKAHIL
jgi:hypothetical protein